MFNSSENLNINLRTHYEYETVLPGQHYISSATIDVPPPLPTTEPPKLSTSTPLSGEKFSKFPLPEMVFDSSLIEISPKNNSEVLEELSHLRENVKYFENKTIDYEQTITSLSIENEKLQTELELINKKKNELEKSVIEFEEELAEIRRDKDDLNESNNKNECIIKENEKELRRLQTELNSNKKALEQHEIKSTVLQDELYNSHNKIQEQESLTNELHTIIRELKNNNESRAEELSLMKSKIQENEKTINDLNEFLETKQQEKIELQHQNLKLKCQLLEFRASTSGTPISLDKSGDTSKLMDEDSIEGSMYHSYSEIEVPAVATSLCDEITALKDNGDLPIGLEQSSIYSIIEKMMNEHQEIVDRHINELEKIYNNNFSSIVSNSTEKEMAYKLTIENYSNEERLREMFRKLLVNSYDKPCSLVTTIINMRLSLESATGSLAENLGNVNPENNFECKNEVIDTVVAISPYKNERRNADQGGGSEDNRTCSEISWGRAPTSMHPLRQVSIEGSDAGSQTEHDIYTCNHFTPEKIKFEVHRELQALQTQINKSIEVLATLARSNDLLSVLKAQPVDSVSILEDPHNQSTNGNNKTDDKLTKSCPILSTQLNLITNFEDIEADQRITGSTGNVNNEVIGPSPKRFRSSSFVAAIQSSDDDPSLVIEMSEKGDNDQLIVEISEPDPVFDNCNESPDDIRDRASRKLSVLHEEDLDDTQQNTLAPPPYRYPPNPYQSRSFESYLDPAEVYSDQNTLPKSSFKRQTSDPTPTKPPPYRDPPSPRLVLFAQVHREDSSDSLRSTTRPLQLHAAPSSPAPTKTVHFDPQSPPYVTPPNTSPWISPRGSTCLEEAPLIQSNRASALRASLRQRSCRVTEDNSSDVLTMEVEVRENDSPVVARTPRRTISSGLSSTIQRAVAVDFDESDDLSSSSAIQNKEEDENFLAFPSLPDFVLRQLNLTRDNSTSSDTLTETDIENKFTQLSLAFKTDKLTLENRLEIQKRQREDGERNYKREIDVLKTKLNKLRRLCQDSDTLDELTQLQQQIEILGSSIDSFSRAAEVYGAVQQEDRVSHTMDVILAHVENLRRTSSKERTELEETRRLLQEASDDKPSSSNETSLINSPIHQKMLQNTQGSTARRRASFAAITRPVSLADKLNPLLENSRARSSSVFQEVRRISQTFENLNINTANRSKKEIIELIANNADNIPEPSSNDEEDIDDSELIQPDNNIEKEWASMVDLRESRSFGQNENYVENSNSIGTIKSIIRRIWMHINSYEWPWSSAQTILMLRRGATAILLILAVLTILFVIVPVSSSVVHGGRVVCWYPFRIELPSHFRGSYNLRIPPPV